MLGMYGYSLTQGNIKTEGKKEAKYRVKENNPPAHRPEPGNPTTRHDPAPGAVTPASGRAAPSTVTERDEKLSRDTSAEPAGPDKDNRLENVEKAPNAQDGVRPPAPKTPRVKLTDEEKAERAQARKLKLAQDRAEAKAAKITQLGGKIVMLPAVVLRDMTILEVSPAEARAWLDGMTELSADTESTGFPVGHPEHALRLVQLGNEHSAVVLDPQDPEQAAVARDALRAAEVLHAHSAHADLVPLEHAGLCGPEAWDKMTDTLLLAKLSDPRLCDSDEHGLKALAKALLGEEYAVSWRLDALRKEIFAAGGWIGETEMDTEVTRSGWAMIPLCEAFVRYAASDVMDCAGVARALG